MPAGKGKGVELRGTWEISSLQLLTRIIGAKTVPSVGKPTAHVLGRKGGRGWQVTCDI